MALFDDKQEEIQEKRRLQVRKPPSEVDLVSFSAWNESMKAAGYTNLELAEMLSPCTDEAHFYKLKRDPNIMVDPETNRVWRTKR